MSTASSSKPAPRDLSHHFGRVTQARKPSNIKQFYKYFMIPGIGNVAGGMPNNNYFPFDTLEGSAALPDRFKPTPNKPVDPPAVSTRLSSSDPVGAQVVVPKESDTKDLLREIDLKTALQYGTAQGYPPLYAFLRQFARENLHPNVPYEDGPEIILTCGSTDGMSKTVEAFTNPWFEGDPIEERQGLLCEEFAYTNALQAVKPRGLNVVPVKIDDEGMVASGKGGLEDVLENWDSSRGKRPHLIYTVTIGQNPTSGTLSVERRKALYAIACKYDVLIIEDDPYWYLQYPSARTPAQPQTYNFPNSSGFKFLDTLVPSYLSVDHEGRVIRLDTFSKTVAPGCRLGWVTAQPAIVDKLLRITETSTQQPSGYVQAMIAQLVMGSQGDIPKGGPAKQDGWKMAGWVRWLEGLRGEYERRMNDMCGTLEEGKHLVKTGRRPSLETAVREMGLGDGEEEEDEWRVISSTQMYDFQWPMGGMFVWIELKLESHPLAKKYPLEKLARAFWVLLTQKPYLVLVSPGTMFSPTEEIQKEKGWRYFRMCFAAVSTEDVKNCSDRFVDGVRAFWRRKDLDGIDELAAQSADIEAQAAVPGFC